MSKDYKILGVVLAGGQSSRMGQNKALLIYNGITLVEHMTHILNQSGVALVVISGAVDGYESIPDPLPFQGPAQAMGHIMNSFSDYDAFLFVPVDMPFLTAEALRVLQENNQSTYFEDMPLPAFILRNKENTLFLDDKSVKDVLKRHDAVAAQSPMEYARCFRNLNTPQDWQEAVGA